MIVAVGMFTVLMLLIMGAFLSVTDASRKTRSTRVALDNVSAAVDYMAREIRLGSYFRCENDAGVPSIAVADMGTMADCAYGTGGNILSLERAGGVLGNTGDQLIFWYDNGRLWRSTDSGVTAEPLTAAELNITYFRFFVTGTGYSIAGGPADQPKVTIVMRGVSGGGKVKTQTAFSLQTTLSARTPNIPPS